MNLLFNDIDELRKHISFLYATAEFYSLRSDLLLATEDLISVVGEDIYTRVQNAYENDFTDDLSKELISLFQYPIAMLGYLSYVQNADISHEDSGRKVKIDKDSESMPWEWQVIRDNEAIRNKGNRGIDRLITFLDKHIDELPEWKDCEQRKDTNSLFVKSAKEFDQIVPIDGSRVFYLRVLPFIRKEYKELRNYLGTDRYSVLKNSMRNDSITEEQSEIIGLCREIIPLRVMATAVRRLAIQVLPESVVMRFDADRSTMKASTPVSAEMITSVEKSYLTEADQAITRLQQFLTKQKPENNSDVLYSVDYSREKFFTV